MIPRTSLTSILVVLAACSATAQRSHLESRKTPLQVSEPDQGDRELRMTPTVRAVQRTANAVVSIYIQAQGRTGTFTEGQGSGVILDERGLVITNWHVVAPVLLPAIFGPGHSVLVRLRDGRAFPAKVLTSSDRHDLALLQLDLPSDQTVQPVEIGRSADLMIGETTIAIGNPQGHANTVTQGVLSATDRSIRVQGPDGRQREYSGLLQTDAAINHGNSGGALLDITGRLIGINNAMAVGAENIGFAIPVDTVRAVFEKELLGAEGFASADSPWLGLDVETRGDSVVVAEVANSGPASRAGVRRGDVLVQIGRTRIRSKLDYARTILTAPSSRPITLVLQRGDEELRLTVEPWTQTQHSIFAMTGLLLEEITPERDRALLRKATLAFYQGSNMRRVSMLPLVLRVLRVEDGSPANDLGLSPGDLLLAVTVRDMFGWPSDRLLDSARTLDFLLQANAGSSLPIVVLSGDEVLTGNLPVRRAQR
ncbi:MAG: trypsin-like peptidase domain-containing protein [Planctomycetota bacterium]